MKFLCVISISIFSSLIPFAQNEASKDLMPCVAEVEFHMDSINNQHSTLSITPVETQKGQTMINIGIAKLVVGVISGVAAIVAHVTADPNEWFSELSGVTLGVIGGFHLISGTMLILVGNSY